MRQTPVPYFGGKSRIASWIGDHLPPHRVYLEPFAGSAAVLFAKTPAKHEILNDVDGYVITFFRVLRERPDELELACRLTPYARDEFEAATLNDADGLDDLERARRWWIHVNQGFAHVPGNTGWGISIARNASNPRTVMNRIERFAWAAERLSVVSIENRDALELIRDYSVPDGAIYADPPYLAATRDGLRRRPSGDYRHEFSTEEEHRTLAAALHASSSAVVLSGYHSPLYDELYADWWRVDRRVVRGTSNNRSAIDSHATEVLWSNRRITSQQELPW